ncbi:MAG: formylglycine-generating enzyme family protein [Armatimonadetes bacterium]|nr:formylglycine-generating enzyme family protein [Armatimonadota bacterium]
MIKLLVMMCVIFSLSSCQNDESDEKNDIVNDGFGNYLFVPAGQFSMGDNFNEGNPRELPVHQVFVSSYYIGEYEVTNGEFKKFIDDNAYQDDEFWQSGGFGYFSEPLHWNDLEYNGGGIPGNEEFPVAGISWFEAKAYCAWLSAQTEEKYRLPTEAEWEKAARGGDFLDGDERAKIPNPIDPPRRYPWGNEIDGSYANYIDSGDPLEEGLTPVGYYDGSIREGFQTSRNFSPYGAFDMAGNVYEWCRDDYIETYYQECLEAGIVTDPQCTDPSFGGYVIRGSAFLYETFKLRCAYRGAYYPQFRGAYIGIRCVREVATSSSAKKYNSPTELTLTNFPKSFPSKFIALIKSKYLVKLLFI